MGVQAACIGPMVWLQRALLVEGNREVQKQHVYFWRLETLIGHAHQMCTSVSYDNVPVQERRAGLC
eukprot:scaffold298993_cov17-Tisochrysis_lutea.AAC.1